VARRAGAGAGLCLPPGVFVPRCVCPLVVHWWWPSFVVHVRLPFPSLSGEIVNSSLVKQEQEQNKKLALGPNDNRRRLGPLSALSFLLIGVGVGVGAVAWGIEGAVVVGGGGEEVGMLMVVVVDE
jgi:hypothetical protein